MSFLIFTLGFVSGIIFIFIGLYFGLSKMGLEIVHKSAIKENAKFVKVTDKDFKLWKEILLSVRIAKWYTITNYFANTAGITTENYEKQ